MCTQFPLQCLLFLYFLSFGLSVFLSFSFFFKLSRSCSLTHYGNYQDEHGHLHPTQHRQVVCEQGSEPGKTSVAIPPRRSQQGHTSLE